MKKRLLIVGAGGLGRVVLEHAEREYKCSFLDDNIPKGSLVDGSEVVGCLSDLKRFANVYDSLVVAIGDNSLRQNVYTRATEYGYSFPNIVSSSAYISNRAYVGFGCIILNNAVIQNGAHCGNGVILNPGVELHHDGFVDDYSLIYTNSVVRSLTHVGKRVWIGSNVTICTGEIVLDDTVIYDNRSQK